MIQETDHREYESNTSENSKSSPQLIESQEELKSHETEHNTHMKHVNLA